MSNFNFTPVKKILVPTDFSGNADHALKYAAAFASRVQGKLVLYHSAKVPIAAINETVQVTAGDEIHESEAHEQLAALKKKISSQNEGVEVETAFSVGFAVEEI